MIDKRPLLIVMCAGVADVVAAVNFVREHELPVAVRGGGHNVSGTGVCDDGVVIDLSLMRGVRVDPERRTVWAQGGCTWADIDRETQPFGLAVPGGVVSETGIAGLTLSGGYSNQRRAHGMTIDNLVACELVTADGRYLRASEDEHPDLFWALRGGGGNFGVVTAFEYTAHPHGPALYEAEVYYPVEQAREVLAGFRDALAGASDEITGTAVFWSFPAIPDLPAELHGAPFLCVAATYAGPVEEGEKALRPLRELGTPIVDASRVVDYVEAQSSLDALLPAGRRYYWTGRYLNALEDDAIDLITERCARGSLAAHAGRGAPDGRCHGPRAGGGDRLRRPQRPVPPLHRRELGGAGGRRAQPGVGEGVLRRVGPLLVRPGVLQLRRAPGGGRPGDPPEFRAKLRKVGRGQDRLRPREPLPAQPEHRTKEVRSRYGAARLDWAALPS